MSDAKKKCDLPQLDLECILLRAGVPVKHWPEWADLTYFGIRPSDARAIAGGPQRPFRTSFRPCPNGTSRSLGSASRQQAISLLASSLRVLLPSGYIGAANCSLMAAFPRRFRAIATSCICCAEQAEVGVGRVAPL